MHGYCIWTSQSEVNSTSVKEKQTVFHECSHLTELRILISAESSLIPCQERLKILYQKRTANDWVNSLSINMTEYLCSLLQWLTKAVNFNFI